MSVLFVVPSLPSRERGLKSPLTKHEYNPFDVAPLAGAWIEKTYGKGMDFGANVAPLAGAWIEIPRAIDALMLLRVAPLAGAWIEIKNMDDVAKSVNCRSPRGSVD